MVVASLIDKVPNLAGLTRTCEVFNAEKLVLQDAKVVKDPMFESVAVTAHHWMPIEEVKPADVADYLARMRDKGYTIVAAEQTSNSCGLEHYDFPEKVVLLLGELSLARARVCVPHIPYTGKEKEGVPVELLSLVDTCVEIPQFGFVR